MGASTYNPKTDIGQVRLLCADTDVENSAFNDAELQVFLEFEGNSKRRAAAMALETLAASEAKIAVRVQRGGGISEDLTQISVQLRAQAQVLRQQATENEGDEVLEAMYSPNYERFSNTDNILSQRGERRQRVRH